MLDTENNVAIGDAQIKAYDHQIEKTELELESLFESAEVLTDVAEQLRSLEGCEIDQQRLEAIDHQVRFATYDQYSLLKEHSLEDNFITYTLDINFKEGVKNIIRSLWETIYNLFFKIVRFIRDRSSQFFQSAEGLSRGLDRMDRKIDELRRASASAAFQATVNVTGGTRIQTGGRVDPSELIDTMENARPAFSSVHSVHLEHSKAIVDRIERLTQQLMSVDRSSADKFESDVFELNDMPVQMRNAMRETTYAFRGTEIPGGQRFDYVDFKRTSNDLPRNLPYIGFYDFDSQRTVGDYLTAPVASLNHLQKLVVKCRGFLEDIDQYTRQTLELSERFEAAVEKQDRLFKRQAIRESIQDNVRDRPLNILLRYYQLGLPGHVRTITDYQYGIVRATMVYIKNCLKQYKV